MPKHCPADTLKKKKTQRFLNIDRQTEGTLFISLEGKLVCWRSKKYSSKTKVQTWRTIKTPIYKYTEYTQYVYDKNKKDIAQNIKQTYIKPREVFWPWLPIDSIWKLKVSSVDNFLLDFSLPCKFTSLMHPSKETITSNDLLQLIQGELNHKYDKYMFELKSVLQVQHWFSNHAIFIQRY